MSAARSSSAQFFQNLIYAPFYLMLHSPLWLSLGVVVLIASGCVWAYYNVNSDFGGFATPPYDRITVQGNFDRFTLDSGRYWQIEYESARDSTYQGYVRHINPDRASSFPMMTHDILVTTGDYANPKKVSAHVQFHMFVWKSLTNAEPQGSIHLIHAVPVDESIYRKILKIRSGMTVKIIGREIYRATYYDPGNPIPSGSWQDHGCNTLLIRSVDVLHP